MGEKEDKRKSYKNPIFKKLCIMYEFLKIKSGKFYTKVNNRSDLWQNYKGFFSFLFMPFFCLFL